MGQDSGIGVSWLLGVIMLSQTQLRTALKRARTIASGDYDEDAVRRLLAGLEDELAEVSLEPTFAEALEEIESLTR
jgi:hypothetical protein